jgi:hypothetical protein
MLRNLDRRMNGNENGNGAGGGALELHLLGNNGDDPVPGIQYSNSTGSDPMIAAI